MPDHEEPGCPSCKEKTDEEVHSSIGLALTALTAHLEGDDETFSLIETMVTPYDYHILSRLMATELAMGYEDPLAFIGGARDWLNETATEA